MALFVVEVFAHPTVCRSASRLGAPPRSRTGRGRLWPPPDIRLPERDQVAGGAPQVPVSADVWIVASLGLLGGALASAVSIRKMTAGSRAYHVPVALALLKVPSGALTAVAGILLLGGGFVPGLSDLDSQRQILAYALVFGYAQQLATQFIDQRAESCSRRSRASTRRTHRRSRSRSSRMRRGPRTPPPTAAPPHATDG